jgi:hypothetical protein
MPLTVSSRLVQRGAFVSAGSRARLVDRLLEAERLTPGVWLLVSAPTSTPGDGQTSVTDAWRETIFHTVITSNFNFNSTRAEKEAAYERVSRSADQLRAITPDATYIVRLSAYQKSTEWH